MRHILELSAEEKQNFLDSFDLVLTDCDGVLWSIVSPIHGSGKALSLLEACEKRIGYISNNSMRTDEDYKAKLKEIGTSAPNAADIVHPVKIIIRHFKKINFNGLVYSIADKIFNNALRQAGYNVMDEDCRIYESMKDLAEHITVDEPVRAVILDIDINMNVTKLIRAQHYLKNDDCVFILGASDKMIPLTSDLKILGPADFAQILTAHSGKQPLILGKPGEMLGKFLIEHFQIKDPSRVLFIGDALIQDIGFGKSCGFQTMAVLSGATNKEELFKYFNENQSPKYYANSLADFSEFFTELNITH